MMASSPPKPQHQQQQHHRHQQEHKQHTDDTEDDDKDADDARLEQMLWRAERLASEIKQQQQQQQQASTASGSQQQQRSAGSSLFSVPDSIEMKELEDNDGSTECSSVGFLLSPNFVEEIDKDTAVVETKDQEETKVDVAAATSTLSKQEEEPLVVAPKEEASLSDIAVVAEKNGGAAAYSTPPATRQEEQSVDFEAQNLIEGACEKDGTLGGTAPPSARKESLRLVSKMETISLGTASSDLSLEEDRSFINGLDEKDAVVAKLNYAALSTQVMASPEDAVVETKSAQEGRTIDGSAAPSTQDDSKKKSSLSNTTRNMPAVAQSEAEIVSAITAAREMQFQLKSVLESSPGAGNMESTSVEDDVDIVEAVSEKAIDQPAVEILDKKSEPKVIEPPPAMQRQTREQQEEQEYIVPVADYSRPPPVFEKVASANEGDLDYVPLRDYSDSPKRKSKSPVQQLSFSEQRLAIRKRRAKRRRQRLAVLVTAFVVAIYLLYRRYYLSPAAAEWKNPATCIDEDSTVVVALEERETGSATLDTSENATDATTIPGRSVGDDIDVANVDVSSNDEMCLFPFAHIISPLCSSGLTSATTTANNTYQARAEARAKRRESVERLVQSMMQ